MNIIKLKKKIVDDKQYHLRHCEEKDYEYWKKMRTVEYENDNIIKYTKEE